MCGIAGLIDLAGRKVDADRLRAAGRALHHRGPDDHGLGVYPTSRMTVGLAATRLAVLDPSPAGHQPMTSPDGRYVLVFNGEVYNHRELRIELQQHGVRFVSRSDTEAVLQALMLWGTDAFNRFSGMWALAFFDVHEQRGFLCRDPIGIKPLFWIQHEDHLGFASEIPSLMALHDWPGDLDSTSLVHYLQYGYIPHPKSVYRQVENLRPGAWVGFSPLGVDAPVEYYSLPTASETPSTYNYSDLCERTRECISSAVAQRRVADVPLGAFLSGGLDSSIVVAHLARCSPSPIKTFCIGYADHGFYDERRYARLVAERFGTDHHEVLVTVDEVLAAIEPLLDHLGQPFGDSSLIPTSLVSRAARAHVTVALSGDGGDEVFGGYWRYLGHDTLAAYRRWPGWLRHGLVEPVLRRARTARSSPISNRVRQFRKLLRESNGDPFARHLAWSRIMAPEAEDIVLPTAPQPDIRETLGELTAGIPEDDPLNAILAFDTQYSLPGDMLHKVDLASMFHSLEVRVPLLDRDLLEKVVPLPSEFKVWRGLRKRLLVDAHRDWLPHEILERPKKGFEVPMGEFLRGPLRDMFHDTVTRSTVESFGLFDYDAIQRIYADHCARRGEHADLLYSLLVLCWWYRRTRSSRPS